MGCEAMYDILVRSINERVSSHIRDFPTQNKVNEELKYLRGYYNNDDTRKLMIELCIEEQRKETFTSGTEKVAKEYGISDEEAREGIMKLFG